MTVKKLDNMGKLPILYAIIVVLIIALAGTGFFVLKGSPSNASDSKPKPEKETLVCLPEFVLNLADTGHSRYLKMEISLGVLGDVKHSGGHGKESDPNLPIIRDAIIGVASKYTYNQLLSVEGKEKLKTEIMNALEDSPVDLHVANVYFTSFAMQ